ncbi:hypothetical protein [uncultured Tenacibaculum sp.]|uniref:hypothetical protein n=1 Tax=uncultured Tenacibaculum sp. TaxID=174713 RepID=UPI0026200034|nr:hypothetical protein [uncultured Tenacibaculum sp.]
MNKKKYLIVFLAFLNVSYINKPKEHNIAYYKQILNLKNICFNQIETLLIIEEYINNKGFQSSDRKGVVIYNTSNNGGGTYTYSVDLKKKNSLRLSDEFYKTNMYRKERDFIFQLAVSDFKYIHVLEKINPDKEGKLNYVIAGYNKSKNTSFKIIYLHDVVMK